MASAAEPVVFLDESPLVARNHQDEAGPSRAASAEQDTRRRRSQQGSTTTRQAQAGASDIVDLTALDDTAADADEDVVVLMVKPSSRAVPRQQQPGRGLKRVRQPTPVSGASASAGAVVGPSSAGAAAAAAQALQQGILQQPGLPPMPVPAFYAQQQAQQAAAQEATGSSPAKGFGNCPICLDKMEHPSTTPCGHLFCEACVKNAIKAQRKCPKCRKTVQLKQIHRIYPDA